MFLREDRGAPGGSDKARTVAARAGTIGWTALYAYMAIGLVCVGLDTAIHFNGPAIDGPFQLFNALRRIDLGYRVGTGFQFFHGAGVPYLHFVPFKVLGGDFFASELSRQLVSTVLFGATFFILFHAWTRSIESAARLSIGAVCLVIVTRSDALFFPINSLLGVRSTMPLLLGALLVAPIRGRPRAILAGVTIGFGLLFGTEQGLAMIAAVTVATALRATVRTFRRTAAIDLLVMLASAVATYVLVVVALGGVAGLKGAVSYNFGILPKDQFWYFGGPPNRFFHRWRQLWEVPTMARRLTIIALGVIVGIQHAWRHRKDEDPRAFAESYLAGYAVFSLVSIFGTLVAVYLQPGVRTSFVLLLLAVHRWNPSPQGVLAPYWNRVSPLVRWREWIVVALIVAHAAWWRWGAIAVTLKAPMHFALVHVTAPRHQELSEDWRGQLEQGRRVLARVPASVPRDARLWSTYSTIIEADAGIVHPSFDYLIHALGPDNRRDYVRTFVATRPAIVQTVMPTHTIYEEWLEDNHWEFYRELLRSYNLIARSEWGLFWERRASPFDDRPSIVAAGALQPAQTGIALDLDVPDTAYTVLEVEIRYHVDNPWRRLPFFGGLPRYIIDVKGASNMSAVSLAPYETTRRFPVIARGKTRVLLSFKTESLLPGASFGVDSVRVTRLEISPHNMAWVRDFASPRFGPSDEY